MSDAGEIWLDAPPLDEGRDPLRTGEGARALIRLSDGSRIFLNESTTVAIGEDTGVSVVAGEIWLDAPPLDEGRDPLEHSVGPAKLALSEGGASLSLTDAGATIYVAKGVALMAAGGGLVAAAALHDPSRSRGLDGALRDLVALPFGQVLVALISSGFAAYGVYSFARARHAKV